MHPTRRHVAAAAAAHTLALATLLAGCGPRLHTVVVTPDIPDAVVIFDDQELGRGPTEVSVPRHDNQARSLRVCGPPGWFCTETSLDARTPHELAVVVPRDNAWHDTVGAEALVNLWHELPALTVAQAPRGYELVREVVADAAAATPEGAALEVDDPAAYYLRTPWQVAGEPGDRERIRSRMVLALSESTTAERLAFKLRIESERIDERGLSLASSPRTFAAFVDAHEDAALRLAELAAAAAPSP